MFRIACRGTTILCFLTIIFPGLAQAQPEWLTTAIKESASYPAEEASSELILYSTQEVEFNAKGQATSKIRTAKRILKTPGAYSGMFTESKTSNREIEDLNGWRISPNGTVERLSDENIAVVAPAGLTAQYDEHLAVVAGFPHVEPGDVVAFEYEIDDRDWSATHQRHSFQVMEPVQYSEFTVILPEGWNLHKSEWNVAGTEFTQQRNIWRWTARKLPMRPEEKLMPPWSYLERNVTVFAYSMSGESEHRFENWTAVASWVQTLCDPMMTADDPGLRSEAIRLTEKLPSRLEKIRAVSEYVRDNIRYVAVEIGKGRWEPRPSVSTMTNRYGDCKDKVTLLRGMLKNIGVPSVAVLANTTRGVHADLPSPFQFNHLIIAIPLSVDSSFAKFPSAIAGKWLFFDPTDEVNPFGALPVQLQGSRVLVADPSDSVLVRLPYAAPEENQRTCLASVAVQENGSLIAGIRIVYRGPFSHYVAYTNKTTTREEQLKPYQNYYAEQFPEVKLTEYSTDANRDSAWVSFRLVASKGLKKSGDNFLLRPNLFPTREIPSFPKTRRQHPVWFGGPELVETDVNVALPAQWKFELNDLAKSDSCMDVALLSYHVASRDNRLRFTSKVSRAGELIAPEDSEEARAFAKELRSYVDLTLIIKTK